MTDKHARRCVQAQTLETVIRVKEAHLSQLTAQALEHARLAIEKNDAEHARKAMRLRESAAYWQSRIKENRDELSRLHREAQ